MSIFNELILPKITEIPKAYVKSFNDDLKAAFASFQKFEEEFQNGKAKAREKSVKDKTLSTLKRIDEDEDEPKTDEANSKSSSDRSSTESTSSKRGSKKRSKHEVDGMSSPEQEKRLKRNASVKAQSIISKQKTLNDSVEIVSYEVNVNLTQKLRRENSLEKTKGRRRKDDDKENAEPIIPAVQVKEEKVSIAPEPMDMESLPLDVEVKQELDKDDIAMPPPSMPVPKQRKAAQKDKVDDTSDEEPTRRRTTRTKKQTDTQPAPASTRSTRASNRATKQTESEDSVAVAEARPKRTRGKKAAPETSTDTDKDSRSTQDSGIASPAEKPRPKRTRKLQKNKKDEEPPKEVETPPIEVEIQQPVIVKEERISQPEYSSPLLQKIVHKTNKVNDKTVLIESRNITENGIDGIQNGVENGVESAKDLEETRVISKVMDTTVVLPNGVYNHASVSPKNNRNMNETVVLETCNQTVVLDKPKVMDSTVVIDKGTGSKTNLTDDNSLLTDDESVEMKTPPKQTPKVQQPTSAVKEKVQQFEEMASRVTRTKTRAMKKQEVQQEADTQTPPDKVSKVILSADNLNKMNNMIFNGKSTIPVSNSASKTRVNTASSVNKAYSSTSKLSGINKAREAAEEYKMEDARRKKEAMLEAKREMQKKKREEKMAAAAAAREAAERERRLALAAAAKEKQEKQLHADMGKLEKLKEVEKKKQELARKVQETEERRKAEELARQKRLEEEQRKAREMRKRQLEEADKMKKEAALMEREIERKQREFIEKQKLKQRMEEVSAMKTPRKYPPIEPAYMQDGFQYLNSDEEADPVERPMPTWASSKARFRQLSYQNRIPVCHIDKLFSVREHTPDLREIFPNIDRSRLKRTSSAVWRSPARLAALHE
ncbi:inner centromere protein A isoform X2 [Colias croceus]|uniref:inner centromere protein A isoform X2 n=1 Tax=Colias crocea TaxID=72248 RepID=UPI001E27CB34|nr:inner centromere protein A isoform X2 [Colias croceus]